MTRALAYAGLACAVLAFIIAMCTGIASAEQCNCPAPPEPPTLPQPLPALQPGGGYVWIAYIAGGVK